MTDKIPDLSLIQKAYITKLRGDTALLALLNNDTARIKEYQVQTPQFIYPNVRVDVNNTVMVTASTDVPCMYENNFRVMVYSEQDSSRESNHIATAVLNCLIGTQIRGTNENGVNYLFMLRVVLVNAGNAMCLRDKLWQSILSFRTELHLT